MTITNVTVLGTGVLGSQIAFQTAYRGFQVLAYDLDEAAIAKARKTIDVLAQRYAHDLPDATPEALAAARARLAWTTDFNAAAQADLIIEAVPEQLALKREVYARLGAAAPAHTIFATNSSTLLPSAMADATGRPAQFLALHFGNEIWRTNIAEVMGHAGTDPEVFNTVVAFAERIGMVPIAIHKEKAGYVLNSLLVPLLTAAAELFVDGIAAPQDIDRTWKIATGSPKGPFEIYDIVGLGTAYQISSVGGPKMREFAKRIKNDYIDQGKMGVASGEGFYTYRKPGA